MKKFQLASLLALPILGLAACGGIDDILGNTDGGAGACPSGTTLYSLPASKTQFSVKSATNINDSCNVPPLSATELMTSRSLQYNVSQGAITLYGSDGVSVLGSGAVQCNTGTLVSQQAGVQVQDTTYGCQYDYTRSSLFQMTSNDTFTVQFTETQSNFKQIQGRPTCKPPTGGGCSVSFNLSLGK